MIRSSADKLLIFLISLVIPLTAFALLSDRAFEGVNLATGQATRIELKKAKTATVAVFLSAKCPCSIGHEATLKELYEKFQPKGFQFIGINSNAQEKVETSRPHFSAVSLGFPVIRDENSQIANELGALKTPHAFVISPQGDILFSGGVDDCKTGQKPKRQYLRDALDSVSRNLKPDPNEVKTLGCAIERP